jgi:hypothetical protein
MNTKNTFVVTLDESEMLLIGASLAQSQLPYKDVSFLLEKLQKTIDSTIKESQEGANT